MSANAATASHPVLPGDESRASGNRLVRGVFGMTRLAGTMISVPALPVALILAGTTATGFARADGSLSRTAIGFAVATTVAAVSAGVLWLCARTLAHVMFAMLAVGLATGGLYAALAAAVIRQMASPDLSERRGFLILLPLGTGAIFVGVALGVFVLARALRPAARQRIARWSRVLGSVYGVAYGLMGLASLIGLLTLVGGASGDSTARSAISLAAAAMWIFVPGLILTYHGISASMGERSGEFRAPIAGITLMAFAAVLGTGGIIMFGDPPVAAPMPLLHAAAASLPGMTLVALAARGSFLRGRAVRGMSWRQVMLAAAISMTVGGAISIYVESLGSAAGVVLLLLHNGAFAQAATSRDIFTSIRDAPLILSRNEQFIANLITAALLAPLIEEFGKGLGARFMMRPTNTRAQAFVLGAAAGAGFGFLEALLYGVAGIQNDLNQWWVIMLVRGGSSSLHVVNAGVVALAWWYAMRGRGRMAVALFLAAVISHAVWNGIAVTMDSRILGLNTLDDRTLEYVAYATAGGIALAFVALIALIARAVRDAPPPPVEGTALAGLAPWLG